MRHVHQSDILISKIPGQLKLKIYRKIWLGFRRHPLYKINYYG